MINARPVTVVSQKRPFLKQQLVLQRHLLMARAKQQLRALGARCETRAAHAVLAGHGVGTEQVPLQD
jgi:hypothetical protein